MVMAVRAALQASTVASWPRQRYALGMREPFACLQAVIDDSGSDKSDRRLFMAGFGFYRRELGIVFRRMGGRAAGREAH